MTTKKAQEPAPHTPENFYARFYSGRVPKEVLAQVRLAQAAPDLLDALKEFMDMWGSRDAHSASKKAQGKRAAMWEKAHAAIRKAEGTEASHAG